MIEYSFVAGRKSTAPSSGEPGTSSRSRWKVGCWAADGRDDLPTEVDRAFRLLAAGIAEDLLRA